MARLGPSGLAQLFREIANYVSTRLSNYNTKAELDSLLDTKADDNNVVHTSGDETIEGVKTFTASPFVSNYAVTNGFFTKHNSIARNEVPSQIYHSAFRVFDKNAKTLGEYCVEKSTSGSSLLHMDVHTEDSEGNDIMESLYLNLSNDGNSVSFHPAKNNRTDLGMAHYKWANAYIDRVVCTRFTHSVNNGSVYITGGSEYDKGATLVLHGEESSDAGSFIINSRDKTNSLYLVGKPDGTLQWAGQDIALDGNIVHTSGDEYIHGTKMFSGVIHRYADLTTSGDAQVYRFDDTNDNPCGHIYNNVHRQDNAIANGPGAYNAKSGKIMELEIASNDAGVGMVYVAGNTIQGNLETVTSATDYPAIATMGWVNNPATSTNVVHRSGDETIAGIKTFSDITVSNKELHYKDTTYDWTDTSIDTWCDAGHVAWHDKTGNRRMHELVGAKNGVWRKACYINENEYFSVDSNRNIIYWGNTTFNGITIFTTDMVYLNNEIDLTVTPSSTLFSNFIFKDKNHQIVAFLQYAKCNVEPDILGLYINDKDKNPHGIQITSNNYLLPMGNNIWNLGDVGAKWENVYATTFNGNLKGTIDSTTTATTQATSDNSTKIATTAYVKSQGYVNLTSLAGGNSTRSLSHSVGSLVLASCHYSAFYGTKLYANVAGQQLYPCRTEIYTSYSYGFTSIVVLGNDSSLGSGTWRYLGGSDGDFNDASGRVYGMFLRVA